MTTADFRPRHSPPFGVLRVTARIALIVVAVPFAVVGTVIQTVGLMVASAAERLGES